VGWGAKSEQRNDVEFLSLLSLPLPDSGVSRGDAQARRTRSTVFPVRFGIKKNLALGAGRSANNDDNGR